MNQPALFDDDNVRRMVHHNGLRTEVDAARRVASHCSTLQAEVLAAFRAQGPMTAGEAERLPQFAHLAASTVRKRISELKAQGVLVVDGRRDGMTIWAVA